MYSNPCVHCKEPFMKNHKKDTKILEKGKKILNIIMISLCVEIKKNIWNCDSTVSLRQQNHDSAV